MKKQIIVIYLLLCLFSFCFQTKVVFADESEEEQYSAEELEEVLQTSGSTSEEPSINARAAIVLERGTKTILYEKNAEQKRAMASTTKIMTAIITVEQGNLSQAITVGKKAAGTGGSRLGLKVGDNITLQDLLYGLMLKSGNDCAVQIAETIGGSEEGFATLMNQKAEELGLENTHFITPHGLDKDNHYTTAKELALLTDYALKNEKIRHIVGTKTYTITKNGYPMTIGNTNELLGNLEGVYGVKTGFTNLAGRCLVTATKRENMDIIVVVLGSDTKKLRTSDSVKLIQYAYQNYEMVEVREKIKQAFEEWQQTHQITVEKGKKYLLSVDLGELPYEQLPIKKGEQEKIKIEIDAAEQVKAPVTRNEVGTLTLMVDDEEKMRIVLLAEKVDKKGILDYFLEIGKQYKKLFLEAV